MCKVNGKAEILTPHSSHIFQPILVKLETKKDSSIRHSILQIAWQGTCIGCSENRRDKMNNLVDIKEKWSKKGK